MKYREAFLSEIATIVNTNYYGNDVLINGFGLCNRKSEYNSLITYFTSVDFLQQAIENQCIKAIVVPPSIIEQIPRYRFSFIVSDYPEETFYTIHLALLRNTSFYKKYEFEPIIGDKCKIHPSVIIEKNVKIGGNVTIGANSVIASGTEIEDNVYIGCNNSIGTDGFQIIYFKNKPLLIPHVGNVKIASNVCIGDNNTIHRSLFDGYTEINENVTIDSQCYIAHNCVIEKNSVLTAGVRLMGSSVIQKECWIAPSVVVLNRIKIENKTTVGTMSLVNKNTDANYVYYGIPAKKIRKRDKI